MSTQMQLRGGTTAENLLFTGAQREITVDTDRNTLRVHDGVTPGGFALATQGELADATYYYNDDAPGGSVANSYILVPKPNTIVPNTYEDGVLFGFVTANPNTGPATASFQGLGVKSIKLAGGSDPAPGQVSGRVTLVYDSSNDWLELQPKPAGSPPQIRTIGAVVSGNSITISLDPCLIDFRSPSLSSGVVLPRVVTGAISITVPAGATLGTQNGVLGQIAVIAIDNSGTVELAVANLSSLIGLNETSLISTTAISAASSSSGIFYSSSARNNVSYRVVGMFESIQAAAGTWSNAPSKIQGQGGQALIGLQSGTLNTASQNTTSGTSIDFTGIPSWAKRVTITLSGVSTNGASLVQVQLGTSAAVETTGYSGGVSGGSNGVATSANSSGFLVSAQGGASIANYGIFILTLVSGGQWVFSGSGNASGNFISAGGGKSIGSSLTRVRITTVNGTDLFDAGSASIIYE